MKKRPFNDITILNVKHDTYRGYEYVVFEWERNITRILNGYVKIPQTHPFYEKGVKKRWYKLFGTSRRRYRYDYDAVDLEVHGGLTFGDLITKGKLKNYSQPFTPGFWVGWDYVHAGDEMYISKESASQKEERIQEIYASLVAIRDRFPGLPPDKLWLFEEAESECLDAINQLIRTSGE